MVLRINKPLEKDVLRGTRHFLDLVQHQGKIVYKRIHVMPVMRGTRDNTKFSVNKDMRGLSDLQIWITNGPFICAETKPPKGSLTEHQENFRDSIEAAGHIYVVWRSVDDAVNTLAKYGVTHWAYLPNTKR